MTVAPFSAPPMVTDNDFRRYQRFVLSQTGIHLSEAKRALVAARLGPRVRNLGMSSYGTYFEFARADAGERITMFDLLLTNETSFFREPRQFDFMSRVLVPRWIEDADSGRRDRSVSIWSAGCATGEEPYSLAMLLADLLPEWSVEILGTDLSTAALRVAEAATWPIVRARTIPQPMLRRHMLRGTGDADGMMRAGDSLRRLVSFRRVNLNEPEQFPPGPFDLVMCRNVLIYFEAGARRRTFERLIEVCERGGHLLVGHAETLQGYPSMQPVEPTIWRRTA